MLLDYLTLVGIFLSILAAIVAIIFIPNKLIRNIAWVFCAIIFIGTGIYTLHSNTASSSRGTVNHPATTMTAQAKTMTVAPSPSPTPMPTVIPTVIQPTSPPTLTPTATPLPHLGHTEVAMPDDGKKHTIGNMTNGPDGNIWFTDDSANSVGYMTPGGSFREFTVPNCNLCGLDDIVTGSDGNIWFTEFTGAQIGRVTLSGTFSFFNNNGTLVSPNRVALGADGNIWFTDSHAGKLGRITPTGTVTEFAIQSSGTYPYAVTQGVDGNIWFTDPGIDAIGMINPKSANPTIQEVAVTIPSAGLQLITAGPDRNMWFTEIQTGYITSYSPGSSKFSDYYVNGQSPFGIITGPDNNLWITRIAANEIDRMDLSGHVTFTLNAAHGGPTQIIVGPHKLLYYTIQNFGGIGIINP